MKRTGVSTLSVFVFILLSTAAYADGVWDFSTDRSPGGHTTSASTWSTLSFSWGLGGTSSIVSDNDPETYISLTYELEAGVGLSRHLALIIKTGYNSTEYDFDLNDEDGFDEIFSSLYRLGYLAIGPELRVVGPNGKGFTAAVFGGIAGGKIWKTPRAYDNISQAAPSTGISGSLAGFNLAFVSFYDNSFIKTGFCLHSYRLSADSNIFDFSLPDKFRINDWKFYCSIGLRL